MFSSYKEITYGVLFGLGASVLDTMMDARSENLTFFGELATHPGMLLYRLLFVLFGVLIGWLLWRNNKREREMRRLMADIRHFHQEYEARAVVLHTTLQVLLTKDRLPPDSETLVRTAYDKSRDLQALTKQRPVV
jgi:hypothetical protein